MSRLSLNIIRWRLRILDHQMLYIVPWKTSQQHGKYKPIRQPAPRRSSMHLLKTLIDNCKARISMYPNNYQASNLQLSCELTTELEMAAELEMLDNNNDNIIGHASMGTPRTDLRMAINQLISTNIQQWLLFLRSRETSNIYRRWIQTEEEIYLSLMHLAQTE